MVSLIRDNVNSNMVPSCSIQIPKSDRAKLNKIRGESDLRTYCDVVKFLLKYYEDGTGKNLSDNGGSVVKEVHAEPVNAEPEPVNAEPVKTTNETEVD